MVTSTAPTRGSCRGEHQKLVHALAEIVASRDDVRFGACGAVTEEEIAAAERELGAFPPSYRVFLQHYGGGLLRRCQIFGICRDHLRTDVVLRNQLLPAPGSGRYVIFARDVNAVEYYLDLERTTAGHERPVVFFEPDGTGCTIAESFLEFFREAVGESGVAADGRPLELLDLLLQRRRTR
jgi:hypothetical protein